jgi:MFS superfamily sulfate permease-like transporter
MSVTAQRQRIGLGLPDQAARVEADIRPAVTPSRVTLLRNDIVGGVVAGLISVPGSIGYALLAFAPLGESVVPLAVRAGLVATVIGCLAAVALGGRTTLAYAPRSVVAFLISAILLQTASDASLWSKVALDAQAMFTIMLAIIVLAGMMQILLGLLRVGTLVKYMPAPVIAGFQNAAALLILLAQISSLCGFREQVPLAGILSRPGEIQPLTIAVGVLTCAVSLNAARLTRVVPPTILALVTGVVAYYILRSLGLGEHLGPVVGSLPATLPDPLFGAEMIAVLTPDAMLTLAPVAVGAALSIALVTSLDAMLCARVAAADVKKRVDINRELLRVGAGNVFSPLFAGTAVAINLAASFAGQRAGARTSLSVAVHAVFVLLCLLFLAPLIEQLPRIVIAGLLLAVAIQLFDRWSLKLLASVFRGRREHRVGALIDLGIILIVAVVAVLVDLAGAVFLGICVAIVHFLARMSRSIIRRTYRGDRVRSRKARDAATGMALSHDGRKILVIEIEGALFFGTAERLIEVVDKEIATDTSYLILDMRLLRDIDSTGSRALLQMHERFVRAGRYVLITGLRAGSHAESALHDQGVLATLTAARCFDDVDRALEWCEDRLLIEIRGRRDGLGDFPFGALDLMRGMAPHEISTLRSMLKLQKFAAGQTIFEEGDAGTELYLIAAGNASATLDLGDGRELRLITFAAGTAFGEVALLDQEVRSATVLADNDVICYVLSRTDFVALTRMYPSVAIKLLTNLARELSYRLRWANRTVFELDR